MSDYRRSAALHSLGCKVNAYETEAMGQQLEQAGYTIVPFAPGADVYIINTCSVTNIADRKSRQMLSRARKMNPQAVVVAVGCYVQTARQKTGSDIRADIILGNNEKHNLVSVLERFFADRNAPAEFVADLRQIREYEPLSISKTQEHTRAFVKVQDGCDQFCSYCIIPYARGRVRSRSVEDVAEEVKRLAGAGIQEIVLTGIHLSAYGSDLVKGEGLAELTEKVCGIPGIRRVRLGSLEQSVITPEFLARTSSLAEFCSHFHLSLQSGDNGVLSRMNRHYTGEVFAEKIRMLRETFDDPALTTDVIVGFPGETEEEFENTRRFLNENDFYESHIFRYSMRAGTRAAAMGNQIEESVKEERAAILAGDYQKRRENYVSRHAGRIREVLFEESLEFEGQRGYTGFTPEYIRVFMKTDDNMQNQLRKGRLTVSGDKKMLTLVPDSSRVFRPF